MFGSRMMRAVDFPHDRKSGFLNSFLLPCLSESERLDGGISQEVHSEGGDSWCIVWDHPLPMTDDGSPMLWAARSKEA